MISSRATALDVGLLLLIFLLPSSFQITPPSIAIGDFYVSLLEVCIVFLLAHWVLNLLASGKGYRSYFDNYFIAFLGYLCLSLFIGVQAFGVSKALGDFRQYLALFLYFWALRFFGLESELDTMRQRLFTVMAVVAVYILVIFLFFRGALATSDKMADRVFFDNTLLLVMCYGGYMVAKSIPGQLNRAYPLCALALSGLMLLVMQVRSYWIAFAVIVGASVFRQRKLLVRTGVFLKISYVVVTLVSVLGLAFSVVATDNAGINGVMTSINERVASLVNLEETLFGWQSKGSASDAETIGTRVMTAKMVWQDYIVKNPAFGTGCGGELPMVSRLGGIGLMKFSIDNGYLTVLAKFGAVGFTLYGVVIWRLCQLLYQIFRSRFASDDERLLAFSFLTGIFAMLIASFFSSIFIRQQPSLVAFLFVLAETEVMRRNVQARSHLALQRLEDTCGAVT